MVSPLVPAELCAATVPATVPASAMHFAKAASSIVLALVCAGTVSAQTYIGNLNGSATASTFETGFTTVGQENTNLSSVGWTEFSGDTRLFRGNSNTALISTGAYSTYTVRYDTGVAISANTTYTLSFDLGFVTQTAGNSANYSFQLGTSTGGGFTGLGSAKSGTLSYTTADTLNIGSGNFSTDSSQWTTGSSVNGDNLMVTFSLLSYTTSGANSDFFGFDNVKLSHSAVPEPSTYAAIAGGLVLAGTVIVRRRRQKITA